MRSVINIKLNVKDYVKKQNLKLKTIDILKGK